MRKPLVAALAIVLLQLPALAQIKPSSIYTGTLVSTSQRLSDIPKIQAPAARKGDRKFGEEDEANKDFRKHIETPGAIRTDGAMQTRTKQSNDGQPTTDAPLGPNLTFDGVNSADNTTLYGSAVLPPDPNLAVGPGHVVMMANLAHKVFDKSGTLLTGPLKFSQIAPVSGDDGDPIALYDQLADRWLLMQFDITSNVDNNSLIFCISQTNDPTGSYNVYRFPTPSVFPDYPHIAIWNNCYTITTHEFNISGSAYTGQGFYAIDRKKMVEGFPTVTLIRFQSPNEGGYLPACFEGKKTPDAASNPFFVGFDSDELGGPSDRLNIRTLIPDFQIPSNSTISAPVYLASATFDGGYPASRSAIEQPGSSGTTGLDAIGGRAMSRVIYRRFDNSESAVLNFTVNVSGVAATNVSNYQAAMRWIELTRATPSSPWTINQQSTYQPDAISGTTGVNRWMGSTGIDQKGNMAIAYSHSSSTTFPGIYYAERKKSDPANTMSTEQLFYGGSGSQTSTSNRWGDYTAITTDPTDEETMWYTGEYYSSPNSSANWKTRIGSFKVNDPQTGTAVHFKFGGTIARQKESVTAPSGPPNLPYKDYAVQIVADNAPSQPVNITLNYTGTATEGVDYNLLNTSGLTVSSANLTAQFTLRVYNNGINEPDEFIDISYTLNTNGGNGIAGTYNQKHRVTIIGKPGCLQPTVSYTCSGSNATLTATCNAGDVKWYDAAGTTLLFTGGTYTVSGLTGPTTFNVRCEGPDCSSSFSVVTVFPARIYVNKQAMGANTGADWANAYTDLQLALNQACRTYLTEIWVATGTYSPAACTFCDVSDVARNASFNIPAGVKIYGGFDGTETTLAARNAALVRTTNLTILSGDLKGDDGANFSNTEDNTLSLVKLTGSGTNTLLDGFTIKGGRANSGGAGIDIASGSTLQVTNCIVTENSIAGSLIDQQNGNLSTTGVAVSATTWGGQTFTPAISGSLIKADINLFCSNCTGTTPDLILSVRATASGLPTGADLATATITGFNSNAGIDYTGVFSTPLNITAGTQYALIIRASANPSTGTYALTRTAASTYVGGARISSTNSGTSWTAQTTDAGFKTYMLNQASGGAIRNNGTLTVTNSVLYKNDAVLSGGAIYNTGSVAVNNSTLSGNTASSGGVIANNGATANSTLRNTIAFGNTNSFSNSGGGSTSAAYSLFDNMTNVTDGGNNITTATSPFVSATDLHLACPSQAINTGTATGSPALDIEGRPRPYAGVVSLVDIGAYEFQGGPPVSGLSSYTSSGTQNVSGNTFINGGCGGLIAYVQPGSGGNAISGSVTAKVWIEPTVPAYNGRPYGQRHYEVTPATNAGAATGTVTLYFTQAEFDAFNAFPFNGPDLPLNSADVQGYKANLRIIKYSGTSSDNTGSPGSYASTGLIIDPVDSDIIWNAGQNRWEVSFAVNGFSGFLLSNNVNTILPLTAMQLQAALQQGNNALLTWNITAPQANTQYALQRSADGRNNYQTIYQQNGTASINSYTDAALATGTWYYRVKATYASGKEEYSNVAIIKTGGAEMVIRVYPNPVTQGQQTLQVSVSNGVLRGWQLTDALGQVVGKKEKLNVVGTTQIPLPNKLAAGVYQLSLITDLGSRVQKLVIK